MKPSAALNLMPEKLQTPSSCATAPPDAKTGRVPSVEKSGAAFQFPASDAATVAPAPVQVTSATASPVRHRTVTEPSFSQLAVAGV